MLNFNINDYKKSVHDIFQNILKSEFLNLKPYKLSDKELIEEIHNRSLKAKTIGLFRSSFENIENFCTFVKIGESFSRPYLNGQPYVCGNFVRLSNRDVIEVTRSQFTYDLYPIESFIEDRKKWLTDNVINFRKVLPTYCKLNNKNFNWDKVFGNPCNKNKLLFYLYDFAAVNIYGSVKGCFHFYELSDNLYENADLIRELVLKTQYKTIKYILEKPAIGIIGSRTYYEGTAGYWGTRSEHYDIFLHIFEKYYRTELQNRLDNLIEEIKQTNHNIL